MNRRRENRIKPRRPKGVLAMEIAGFALAVLIAVDELVQNGDMHLWIGLIMGIGAIFGACGYLLHARDGRQS